LTERDHDRESERDWDAHDRDHEREREVAKETAQRLERNMSETAARLEDSVQKALRSHERVHDIEKEQVSKDAQAMRERLAGMNEFRSALQDAANRMVTRDTLEQYQRDREQRLQAVIDRIIALEKSQVTEDTVANLREDQNRQRTTMRLAVAGVVLGVFANFIINLLQGAPK
jgi:hypothetical protein